MYGKIFEVSDEYSVRLTIVGGKIIEMSDQSSVYIYGEIIEVSDEYSVSLIKCVRGNHR